MDLQINSTTKSIYKGISPGGGDASLQWRESKGGGGELVHSACSKQPTSLKTSPYLALHCTVQYLFIYLGWGANVCSVALDISDRKDQRATPQMKLSKWPDSWVPRRTSLARTFYYDRSETSQQEGKRRGKKRKPSSPQPERKKKRQNERRCIIAVHDGMNYECVEGIRKQWLKSLGSSPSFLTLSPATN